MDVKPRVVAHKGAWWAIVGDRAFCLTPQPGAVRVDRREHPDGRVDTTVHVPFLRVANQGHGPG